MITEFQCTDTELSSSRTLSSLFHLPKRNLGCAILVAAIEDYQGLEEQPHASAALFLFPSTPEYNEHYDWVLSMANGVDRAWLREALDRARKTWDRERTEKKLRVRFEAVMRGRRSA
ncbi:MAG TPA: hypothetical protein VGM27_01690 [Acidobacteriaceae bacterium]